MTDKDKKLAGGAIFAKMPAAPAPQRKGKELTWPEIFRKNGQQPGRRETVLDVAKRSRK